MIRSLQLRNLKCFETLNVQLAPLTVFSGLNSAGKSTTLQSLLLLAQSLKSGSLDGALRLNGELVSLGSPSDVLGVSTLSAPLQLGFVDDAGGELLWTFRLSEDRRFLEVESLTYRKDGVNEVFGADRLHDLNATTAPEAIRDAVMSVQRVVFLSALRTVENNVYPIPDVIDLQQGHVGPLGQYASWWLHSAEDVQVSEKRACSDTSNNLTLRYQVGAWASQLFGHAEVNAIPITKTNLVRLELKTGLTSDWSRPANNGFGVSYAFPILVSGLISPSGETVVVDSPEAHLHPRGQSKMGAFLAQMAADGLQLLIETHSDHLLNGIRIALREGIIEPEDVAIYFFTGKNDPQVVRLSVSKNGDISEWPEGFFDQSERDLAEIAGWSRT